MKSSFKWIIHCKLYMARTITTKKIAKMKNEK